MRVQTGSGRRDSRSRNIHVVQLTKRRRNEILETLLSAGIDPAECGDPEPAVGLYDGLRIGHRSTESSFTMLGSSNDVDEYFGDMIVGGVIFGSIPPCNWHQLMNHLYQWAKEVEYERDTPDLWAELRRQPEVLAAIGDGGSSNAPFSSAEQAEISERLSEIKDYVRKTFELTASQMDRVEERIDELAKATGRVGPKDWFLLVSGIVFNLIIADAIPPNAAQTIFTLAVHALAHVLGIGGGIPAIGPQA